MKSGVLAIGLIPVLACIWDSDTLDTELRGLPDAEALVVTGRWVRHGKAYYERRIREIPPRLEKNPGDLEAYDDLGVAWERLGEWDKALAVMDRKAAALALHPDPDHEYRMLANRGTFLSHAGRYDEALPVLEKAVALNPDAHFGRERYQIDAIRYIAAAKKDPTLWARENFLTYNGWEYDSTGGSFGREDKVPDETAALPPRGPLDVENARRAVFGILRFGGPEGAELYRVLGDLFRTRGRGLTSADLNLAWWAYHRALDRGHPATAAISGAIVRIEKHWEGASTRRFPNESHWKGMKEWNVRWLAAYAAEEDLVVAAGEDAASEESLATMMAAADKVVGPPRDAFDSSFAARFSLRERGLLNFLGACALIVVAGAVLIVVLRRLRATPARGPEAPCRPRRGRRPSASRG